MNGWVKLQRALFDNPCVTQSSDHLTVWIYLLTHASSKPYKAYYAGKEITLQPGQLLTSRTSIANSVNSRISDSKVQRVLKAFENAHQIEQQTSNKNRLITLINWNKYQAGEQQNEQQMNNKRTTSEQQANTNGEYKEKKKDISCRESPTIYRSEIAQIIEHLNSKLGKNYKPNAAETVKHISARLKEGYTVADCITVIDSKTAEWQGTTFAKYLRPKTLFGSNFESYINTAIDTSTENDGSISQLFENAAPDT